MMAVDTIFESVYLGHVIFVDIKRSVHDFLVKGINFSFFNDLTKKVEDIEKYAYLTLLLKSNYFV